jgi:hypothetical protein
MIHLLVNTLDFVLPVLGMIFLGLFLAGFMMEMGIVTHISRFARPLVEVAHLPEANASAFIVSLGSTVAANGIVAGFKKEGALTDSEVILCAVMNGIPFYLREIFTYQIPIVIPALGLVVGGFYGMVFLVTVLIKLFLVVLLGRLFLKKRSYGSFKIPSIKFGNLNSAVIKAFQGQTRIFLKIALSYFGMTFLVFYLTDEGFFQAFDVIALADFFGLPVETIVPLTSYVASPVLGISLLGPMIHSGSISSVQAMIVLMLGSMLMLPIFALRTTVPNYTAIFGMRLGLYVVIFSTGISILVRLLFLLVLLMMD